MITATQNTSLYQKAIVIAANRMEKMNEMEKHGVELFINDETLHKDVFNDEQCVNEKIEITNLNKI